ncbi:dihydrofolate synthase/folylpolyglutamate synthase [Lactobacillus colini]|uniref:tetrahydrofolate synthase n=1 Tax=Lactobacillus colini TaxID=1819254 RepID=A0ABS4MDQ7_9LACO|nr:folylpolyglutamate synthase/dihydrofolate synthase family protein [Lactobacillus colini]MBP2057820.1 dihydrofolate synthase/folylpolyglutamate synthase [Lactobacillus colini]
MNYQEVIEKIEHLPHLHEKNDLSYIRKILHKLNNPQDKVKTIHVTGTNGKGSTSYYLSNLLQKAGQKTGLFVSPYIMKFNERIQVNGQDISNQELVTGFKQVSNAIRDIRRQDPGFNLVTFEFEVALAFWFFAYKKCDYAVIEVGIGGEHDKTNVIVPEVSVITTIGLDHEKIIGPTIQDIAHEKSGIIKKNKPLVLGNIPSNVRDILLSKARLEHSSVYELGKQFKVQSREKIYYHDSDYYEFNLRPLVESYDIAVSLKAFSLLGFRLPKIAVEQAINQTQIPGRYQILNETPLIIADGAHNIQAVSNLLTFVRKHTSGQLHFLIGMMKDKDLQEVFALFKPNERIILTRIDYPRAAEKKDFPLNIQEKSEYISDYRQAFETAKEELNADDTLVITGSFYLVGAVLNYLEGN